MNEHFSLCTLPLLQLGPKATPSFPVMHRCFPYITTSLPRIILTSYPRVHIGLANARELKWRREQIREAFLPTLNSGTILILWHFVSVSQLLHVFLKVGMLVKPIFWTFQYKYGLGENEKALLYRNISMSPIHLGALRVYSGEQTWLDPCRDTGSGGERISRRRKRFLPWHNSKCYFTM